MGIYKVRACTPEDIIDSCNFALSLFFTVHHDLNNAQYAAELEA